MDTSGTTVATTEQPPSVVRFGQPNLYTHDLDAMSDFYQLLGFEETWRFPSVGAEPAFACLRRGSFFVNISRYDALQRTCELPRAGSADRCQMEIVVIVDDVDAVVGRLAEAGVQVVVSPQDQPWGERHAYVTDPEENYVQVTTHSDVDWSESAVAEGWT